jgi:IS5 family transposase
VVDANGTPLGCVLSGCVLSGANRHDSQMVEQTLNAVPNVHTGRRGAPRFRPHKLHADKGYDSARCREQLREAGIVPRIARRGIHSSQTLGSYRWVIERTFAWLNRFRRLKVRYERRDDIHLAFVLLGCALITWNQCSRFC